MEAYTFSVESSGVDERKTNVHLSDNLKTIWKYSSTVTSTGRLKKMEKPFGRITPPLAKIKQGLTQSSSWEQKTCFLVVNTGSLTAQPPVLCCAMTSCSKGQGGTCWGPPGMKGPLRKTNFKLQIYARLFIHLFLEIVGFLKVFWRSNLI